MIPSGRGTGDGENPGFGPESTGIVVIERQVEELPGLEARQGPLGQKINGIDAIAMIGDFLSPATEFLGWGHLQVPFPVQEAIEHDPDRIQSIVVESGIKTDGERVVHDVTLVSSITKTASVVMMIG